MNCVFIGNSTKRKAPLFTHATWSVYQRILDGVSTTNCYSESDNARLKRLLGSGTPGMWRFMGKLDALYTFYDKLYIDFLSTSTPRGKGTIQSKRERGILETINRIDQLTPAEYLYAVVKATSV